MRFGRAKVGFVGRSGGCSGCSIGLRERQGKANGERTDGREAVVDGGWYHCSFEDKKGNAVLAFGGVLVDGGAHWFPFAVEEADTGEVLTMEQGSLDGTDDGKSLRPGDTVVDVEVIRQGGGEVRGGECREHGAKLVEEEVESHRFVRDECVNAGCN